MSDLPSILPDEEKFTTEQRLICYEAIIRKFQHADPGWLLRVDQIIRRLRDENMRLKDEVDETRRNLKAARRILRNAAAALRE